MREKGALGKRLETLFEAMKDHERRGSLRRSLDKLEDEVRWQSLKSAVDVLQEMLDSIPSILPYAPFNLCLCLDALDEKKTV